MKREAQFTTLFKKWLKSQTKKPACGAYEIKVTTTNRFSFDAIRPHQIDALVSVKTGCFIFKIPDAGWQNPFDVIMMAEQQAYVVIAFIQPRSKTKTYFIDIDFFLVMQESIEGKGSKSVTREELDEFCMTLPHVCQCHSI